MRDIGIEGLWNIPLRLKRDTEARRVAGECLNGDLERSFHETVKRSLGCVGVSTENARAMGYSLRRAAESELNQAKREQCVSVSKAGRAEPSK